MLLILVLSLVVQLLKQVLAAVPQTTVSLAEALLNTQRLCASLVQPNGWLAQSSLKFFDLLHLRLILGQLLQLSLVRVVLSEHPEGLLGA